MNQAEGKQGRAGFTAPSTEGVRENPGRPAPALSGPIRPADGFPGYWVSPVGGGMVLRELKPGKQGVFLYRGGVKVKRRIGKLVRQAFGMAHGYMER